VHIFLILLVCVLLIVYGALHAEQIRTQGRFFDRAADHKITVAYMYDGCRHAQTERCPTRRPVYHANKKMFSRVSYYSEFRAANINFMMIDLSRYRIKNIKKFLGIKSPDTFIVFIDGYVADYDYLTGSPTEQELIEYIKDIAGDVIHSCKNGQCALQKECYNGCNAPHQDPLGRPSFYAAGYYGVMGGEPLLGYGMAVSGYSFSMGFRRSPN
jgi:hypothetical protein